MRTLVLAAALAAFAAPAFTQNVPQSDQQRLALARAQAEQQKRVERAQENCRLNRGVDCDTPQGLQEWFALERSRAAALSRPRT